MGAFGTYSMSLFWSVLWCHVSIDFLYPYHCSWMYTRESVIFRKVISMKCDLWCPKLCVLQMVNVCNYGKMKVIYWLHSSNYYKEMAWSWSQIKLKRHKIQFHFLKIYVKVEHTQNALCSVTHWQRNSFFTDIMNWHILEFLMPPQSPV